MGVLFLGAAGRFWAENVCQCAQIVCIFARECARLAPFGARFGVVSVGFGAFLRDFWSGYCVVFGTGIVSVEEEERTYGFGVMRILVRVQGGEFISN